MIESKDLITELLDVLMRPKFNFISETERQEFLMNFLSVCELVWPRTKISEIKTDPEDNRVLECAIEGKADYIVSGDAHLLALKNFRGIKIINTSTLLKLF